MKVDMRPPLTGRVDEQHVPVAGGHAACGNRYLAQTIEDYAQMSLGYCCHLMTRLDLAHQARDEHKQIVEAVRHGDRDRLAALCLGHTRAARKVYETLQGW